jgi:hypothetical protein
MGRALKKLSLRPYHGTIWLCDSQDELHKAYKRLTKSAYPYEDGKTGGRYIFLNGDTLGDRIYLVWASNKSYLAHEYCHILLHVCNTIGYDPREGDGEPFCYMLSQLLIES